MAAYTTIDNPELYFQVKTWTGTGSSNALTLDGDEDMQPDYVMIKQRSGTQQWNGYDDLRGVQKYLGWNTNIVENTQAQGLTAFGSDGFTVGTDDMVNKSSSTYVAFCWKESATAGFDMITYSGTGSAKNESHSLSATPHWIVTKCRSDAQSWATHHRSYSATEKVLYLDNTNALASTDPDWLTAVSSSTISLGGSGSDANVSGRTYVAYLWSEKQGFSKFGSYTGNGNNDGTFVYTGFRPAWGMFKRTDNTADWYIYDNKRNTFNVLDDRLEANENGAETADGGDGNTVDFLSNGFKLRGSGGSMNDGTFIYMAFAEAPFVNSNGVPANAR